MKIILVWRGLEKDFFPSVDLDIQMLTAKITIRLPDDCLAQHGIAFSGELHDCNFFGLHAQFVEVQSFLHIYILTKKTPTTTIVAEQSGV
jgi:hypothetical protein